MMKLTKERLTEIVRAIDSEAYDEAEIMGWFNSDDIIAMASQLLAGLDQEPVGYEVITSNGEVMTLCKISSGKSYQDMNCTLRPVYASPQLPQPAVVPVGVLKSLLPDAEKPEFWFEHNGKIFFEGVKFNNAVFEACCAAMLQGAEPVSQPDAIDANLVEALRLVQCMVEDYRERNYGDAEKWIRHINTHMSDYTESHGEDAYSILHDLLPAAPQQEVK